MQKPIVLAIDPKTGDVLRVTSVTEAKEAVASGSRLIALKA